VGFEPTIQAFERADTVHALDRAATVIGTNTQLPKVNWCKVISKLAMKFNEMAKKKLISK
jgi:hypothetical protein